MTGFLLDTNVLSEFSRFRQPDKRVDRWLNTTSQEAIFASVLTSAEIRRGIELVTRNVKDFAGLSSILVT